MSRLVIFTDDPGWHGARLKEALALQGFSSVYCSLTACSIGVDEQGRPTVIIPGFEDTLPHGVFVRGVPGGSLEEVVFYLDVLHSLEKLGVPVYNSGRGIEKTVDKGLTSQLLAENGLPTPPTWVTRDRMVATAVVARELAVGHELVLKPLFGSQGEGVQRIVSLAQFEQVEAVGGVYYLQRFVDTGRGYSDMRVFVIAGKAAAAMTRYGTSWLNNVAQGARCEQAIISDEIRQLAEAAVAAVGLAYGGVDIILNAEGKALVIEVNSIPAWKGLQSVTDSDITELLARDCVQYCNNERAVTSCA